MHLLRDNNFHLNPDTKNSVRSVVIDIMMLLHATHQYRQLSRSCLRAAPVAAGRSRNERYERRGLH